MEIYMYGESDGDKKGVVVEGNGNQPFRGPQTMVANGIEFKNAAIVNGGQMELKNTKTDSTIVNTETGHATLENVEIFLKKYKREHPLLYWSAACASIVTIMGGVYDFFTWVINFF